MSNHLTDKRLSLKAKGLLEFLLSVPSDWNCSIKNLAANGKENETAIRSGIKELEKFGYLRVSKVKNQEGKFEYVYEILK